MLSLIITEVQKFCKERRITKQNIIELDKKIQYEIYLKEKKEAIVEDRKEDNKEDAVSNLSKVRAKYADVNKLIQETQKSDT